MLKPAIATFCLGRSSAGHSILSKVKQASQAGFKGVEVFFECLEDHAQRQSDHFTTVERDVALRNAANDVRTCCDEHDIAVVVLQPFMFYDGLLDSAAHRDRISELKLWFELCHILGTDLTQIPTNFAPESEIGDLDRIVTDMTEAADLGLEQSPPIRIAYEAVSWGTRIDVWEGACEIVKRVDRPNLGLCLDTFHIAGRVWGDPAAVSGQTDNADTALDDSLRRLAKQVDPAKIFYIQIGDAERLNPPLTSDHPMYTPDQKPRMTWSRNARLFPYEVDHGAYLPIDKVMETLFVKLRWQGWVSMEMFTPGLYDKGANVPTQFASRARTSWERFCRTYPELVS